MARTVRHSLTTSSLLGLAWCLGILNPKALAGTNVKPPQASSASQQATAGFDHNHAVWTDLLKKNVVASAGGKSTLVDYASIKKDRATLQAYLKTLSGVSETAFQKFSRDEQLAFLINAYNAFIIDLVVESYPISTIKRLGIPFVGPWKKNFIPLLGKKMSPDDLEHGLIRKKYKESRIHFGVNCASISCPPLRAEAFVAERLSVQLDEQATLFFSNEKENRFDAATNTLTLNPILDWFDEDFTTTGPEGHVRYLAKYHRGLAKAFEQGLTAGQIAVKFGDYNWNLNDTATAKTK